jgi:aminopeptidase-like protein
VHVLRHSRAPYEIREFSPLGYDERQFCSPGFDLPVGCLMRAPHGEYPEYHTSADNLALVDGESLADSLARCLAVFDVLERNRTYVNLNPKGEPQLGRRGLYAGVGGTSAGRDLEHAFLWVLNLADGNHSLLDIADRSELPFDLVEGAATRLVAASLLREADS